MGSPGLDADHTFRRLTAVNLRSKIVNRLLDWFSQNARDLPWRHTSDPYAIWVSEVMLQQTQVKTVVPFWERWMTRLPDVAALAAAHETEVLKLWEGLGYYRRARYLHSAAKALRDRHGGDFPQTLEALQELPGVGRYTAGAIASIAFNQPAPILDGNVIRVLTRLGAIQGNPGKRTVGELLWRRAAGLAAAAAESGQVKACSRLNQALMELGAICCTPRAPSCGVCPVSDLCRARELGRPESFPRTAKSKATTAREYVVIVAQVNGRLCVRQRPDLGVNGGLWEFPSVEVTGKENAWTPEGVAGEIFGIRRAVVEPLTLVRHAITRYRITQRVFALRPVRRLARRRNPGRWLSPTKVENLAFTAAHRRIFDCWKGRSGRPSTDRPCSSIREVPKTRAGRGRERSSP